METPTPPALSVWEQKERDGRLSLETPEWRQKRLVAQDPNTPGGVLESFARTISDELDIWYPGEPMGSVPDLQANTLLLGEAILAHPNTPPRTLERLLDQMLYRELGERTLITKAVCRNPLLPLLTLENPDFWRNQDGDVCKSLLREASLPASVVHFLVHHKGSHVERDENGVETPGKDHSVAEAARLHISQGPPLETPLEGCRALSAFWKAYCAEQQQDPDWEFEFKYAKYWHAEMVEVGLAPPWMTPFYSDVPPVAPAFPKYLQKWCAAHPEFAPLLRPDTAPDDLMRLAQVKTEGDKESVPLLLLQHPRATVEILRYIAGKNPLSVVRMQLAVHPLTPPEVLMQLVDVPLKREGWVDDSARYEALRSENTLTRRLACRHPNAPPDLADYVRRAFVRATAPLYPSTGLPDTGLPLVDFITALRGFPSGEIRPARIDPTNWVYSLLAALHLPLTNTPLDNWGRSSLDLMHHLSHSGNLLVRWATRTRLADPDFKFTWQEAKG